MRLHCLQICPAEKRLGQGFSELGVGAGRSNNLKVCSVRLLDVSRTQLQLLAQVNKARCVHVDALSFIFSYSKEKFPYRLTLSLRIGIGSAGRSGSPHLS